MPLSQQLNKVVEALCQDLDCPRSLTVLTLVRYEEWDQLVNLRCVPIHYADADSFRSANVSTEFLRKCVSLVEDQHVLTAKTFVEWWKVEETNCQANARLDRFVNNQGPFEPQDEFMVKFFSHARSFIRSVLGHAPKRVELGFGNGATYSSKFGNSSIPDKISMLPSCTRAAQSIALNFGFDETAWSRAVGSEWSFFPEGPCRQKFLLEFVEGNRFSSVPKDATKNRGIAVEPSLMVSYQLGLGDILKRKLLKIGLDLYHGEAVHKQVACEASVTGQFLTIDLSSASDTICRNLVRVLLPYEWWTILDGLRSPKTRHGKSSWFVLQKFSSMGNGYTFELETLLFASLIHATMTMCGHKPIPGWNFWVYGDDIIAPSILFRELKAVLTYCGFTLNDRKSFSTGCFRESCGGDFFNGVDVRAHYVKKDPNEPQEWISLANGLRRLGCTNPDGHWTDLRFRRAWLRALDAIPIDIRRNRGPASLGDIIVNDGSENWTWRTKESVRYFQCYTPVQHRRLLERYDDATVVAAALYGFPSDLPDRPIDFMSLTKKVRNKGFAMRGRVTGYQKSWVPCS